MLHVYVLHVQHNSVTQNLCTTLQQSLRHRFACRRCMLTCQAMPISNIQNPKSYIAVNDFDSLMTSLDRLLVSCMPPALYTEYFGISQKGISAPLQTSFHSNQISKTIVFPFQLTRRFCPIFNTNSAKKSETRTAVSLYLNDLNHFLLNRKLSQRLRRINKAIQICFSIL